METFPPGQPVLLEKQSPLPGDPGRLGYLLVCLHSDPFLSSLELGEGVTLGEARVGMKSSSVPLKAKQRKIAFCQDLSSPSFTLADVFCNINKKQGMSGRRGGREAGRREGGESTALKSGPAEGRKRDLSRVPPAPRAWTNLRSLHQAKQRAAAGVSLKEGSGEAGQPLSECSAHTGSSCLGTSPWRDAAGTSAYLEWHLLGTHLPTLARPEAWAEFWRTSCRPPQISQQDPWEVRHPQWQSGFGHRGTRENPGLEGQEGQITVGRELRKADGSQLHISWDSYWCQQPLN